jgi:hypothetical protein
MARKEDFEVLSGVFGKGKQATMVITYKKKPKWWMLGEMDGKKTMKISGTSADFSRDATEFYKVFGRSPRQELLIHLTKLAQKRLGVKLIVPDNPKLLARKSRERDLREGWFARGGTILSLPKATNIKKGVLKREENVESLNRTRGLRRLLDVRRHFERRR